MTDSSSKSKRWALLLLGLIAALVLLLLLLRPTEKRQATREHTAKPAPVANRDRVPLRRRSVHPRRPARPPDPRNPLVTRGPKERAEFFLRQAADYRKRARYPKQNLPLSGDQNTDPIANDFHRVKRRKTGRDQDGPQLVLVGPMSVVNYPKPIVVEAYVIEPETQRILDADIVGQFIKGEPNPFPKRVDVVFSRDRKDPNPVYIWSLEPKDEKEADKYNGFHDLFVLARLKSGEMISSTIGWQYCTTVGAELTGAFRDRIEQGSLIIEAEAKVTRPGRYHLALSLYAKNDQPIAWAQNEKRPVYSKPGVYWIPVRIYGLLLFEANEDGPYLVKLASLRSADVIPPRIAPLLKNAYWTQRYSSSQFTQKPFGDPVDLEKAARLEKIGRNLMQQAQGR